MTTYVEYAHAVQRVIAMASRLAAQRGVFVGSDGVAEVRTLADLAGAEEQRTVAWEAVLMLGSDSVVIAARQWHNCVFRLHRIAAGQAPAASWREAVDATSMVRRTFYEAARKDLGVAWGHRPETYEWQLSKWMEEPGADPEPPADHQQP